MSEEYIVTYSSPTLAGLKTANLFAFDSNDREEAICELRRLNRWFTRKGLRAIPIKKSNRLLIYLYRANELEKDLNNPMAKQILLEKGYQIESPSKCIIQLIKKIEQDKEFPHEIGLFLGYPPSDVRCFMDDSCKGVKCSGCWKAYDNEDNARKIFDRYKKCTRVYCRKISEGKRLKDMIVVKKGQLR